MTRFIKPVKPCNKCGAEMTICETSGIADIWGLSECKCGNFKGVPELISEGGVVQYK